MLIYSVNRACHALRFAEGVTCQTCYDSHLPLPSVTYIVNPKGGGLRKMLPNTWKTGVRRGSLRKDLIL